MKNKLKEKFGFTLVELLAVIVVLAIIMLIAVQAVMPLLTDARRKAFVTEAQAAIDAAQGYFMSQALSKGDTVGSGYCIKLSTLISKGYYATKREGYDGWVKITAEPVGSNNYLYSVTMTNGQYYVKNGGVEDKKNVGIDPEKSGTGDGVILEGKDIGTVPEGCK